MKTLLFYQEPKAELWETIPDILCDSNDSWGNEGLVEGEPWSF